MSTIPSPLPPCSKCLVSEGWLHLAHLAEDDPAALAALITREGTSANDRACAARELGRTAPPLAGPVLLTLLDDESAMVREDAAEALGHVDYPVGRAKLVEVAERDPSAAVRAAAYQALRKAPPEERGSDTLKP